MSKGKPMVKGNGNNGGEKKFAPNIGFWPTKSGNGFSVAITEKVMAALEEVKIGGRLYLSEANSDAENAPTWRLAVFAPDEQPRKPAAADEV